MPLNYASVVSIIQDSKSTAVLLSPSSAAVLLSAVSWLENGFAWYGSGDFGEPTSGELDSIQAWVARAERELMGNLTGVVSFSPVALPGALECDGALYQRVDYPALYDVLVGSYLIVDADTFHVPDMVGKFPRGAEVSGGTGGEAEHTITVDEMPSHSHLYTPPILNIDVEAPGVPDLFAAGVGTPAQTGAAGGGQAHNNLPPFLELRAWIWT